MLKDSLFLFGIKREVSDLTEYENKVSFGGYQIKYSKSTPIQLAQLDSRELIIYGYATELCLGKDESLAEWMLENSRTLDDVISLEYYLGGKYLILYKDDSGTYAIPDATASIPFCYSVGEGELVCSSNSEVVARELNLEPDEKLSKIRKKSEISQAMPFDKTIYKEVKQLLPNHYFSFDLKKAERFVNSKQEQSLLTAKAAAEKTAPLIENLLKYYKERFKLYCPITSGRDSRVVLSHMLALKKEDESIEAYTINHKNFDENEADIVIPKKITEVVDMTYRQLTDLKPTEEMYREFDLEFGKTGYSKVTLMIANTIQEAYSDGAVINGDIIGQIGKCSLHRDIPEVLATPKYFRCKLHNYSKEASRVLKEWLEEIKASGEKVNVFDLFSIENRMGRWAAQENLIYNMIGQLYLNIFNSRCIIYEWTRVPRKERKLSRVHLDLIDLKYPKLLKIPFGEDSSLFARLAKINWLSYYVSGFLKYYIERIRFRKGK